MPVVAVTAFAMAEDKERASRAGFDGYIEKPISVRALPGQIEAFLGGAGGLMDIPATVLAVDDQPTNLRLLDAVLTPRGHRVLTAASGAEALALLETEDVDIVLLDILMPEMDGYEVCRRIRSTPATEFLPVVMITASGTEQRLAALEAGADDFVTKPFDQSELLARVASLARIKRYHDTIRRQADELAEWNTELESRVAATGRRAGARPTGCAASCHHNWPIWSSATRPSSRAIAARSSCSSPISGTSPPSRRPASPRR